MNRLNEHKKKAPRFGGWIIRRLSLYENNFALSEDICEEYFRIREKKGRVKSWFWYLLQTIFVIKQYSILIIYWSFTMFKNYLKIALRSIKRYKGYSFINIAGLAFGLACAILIALWVMDQLSYDRFFKNSKDIYRICIKQINQDNVSRFPGTPKMLVPYLEENYPEVKHAARFSYFETTLIKYKDRTFYENNIAAADNSIFDVFSFGFKKGDRNSVLTEPDAIVISERIAEKYFGDEDPVGKILQINNSFDFTVKGVVKNVPHNSHIQFDILVSWEYLKNFSWFHWDDWTNNVFRTYILLRDGVKQENFTVKIKDTIKTHRPSSTTELFLQPLHRIYLYSVFYGQTGPGDIMYIYIFSVIAVIILLIACVNFMNLSTARSVNRAREIGMRKTVGALKINIIRQFLGESFLLTLISLVLAFFIVSLAMQSFNALLGTQLSLNILANWKVIFIIIAITMFTGIIAGGYPAFYLSNFRPVQVIKGIFQTGTKNPVFRKVLVVGQFTLSIVLILCTLFMFLQFNFMKNSELGWDKNNLMYIFMRGDIRKSYNALKKELLKDPRIVNVTAGRSRPSSFGSSSSGFTYDGKDPEDRIIARYNFVDYDYIETAKIEMAEGRTFSEEFISDSTNAYIINQTLAKIMNKKNIIGENFNLWGRKGKIIGVMKDFHFRSLRSEIEPLIMTMKAEYLNFVVIRTQPGERFSALEYITDTWKRVIPNYPIDYRFIEDDFDLIYQRESRLGTLLGYFTFLALLIAGLGLFGLASYTAEQRTKEIGIRKVLGASVSRIISLLCFNFLKLVVIANIIAWPAAWWIMNGMLQDYAYRINLNITTFLLAGFLAVGIAFVTIILQAVKAAVTNPVNSLKYE